MKFGLVSASAVTADGAAAAVATLEVHEGRSFLVRMDEGGVRIVSAADGEAVPEQAYDCVNSLLINCSPAFTKAFYGQIASGLQSALDEQKSRGF